MAEELAPERPSLLRALGHNVKSTLALLSSELVRRRRLTSREAVIADYVATAAVRRLHIGAGGNLLTGWLNTDLEPQKPDIAFLDVSDPLPFPDASLHFIFSEHLIEHLPHELGAYHVRECHRVLKPGGRVRIATPDLQFLIDIYAQSDHTLTQAKYIRRTLEQAFPRTGFESGAFVLNHFMRGWGHQFIYDEQTLRHALERAGFSIVVRWPVGVSDEPALQNIEHHGDAISDEFNRMQTIVVEAIK